MGIFDFLNAVNVMDLVNTGKEASAERTQAVRVAVSVDGATPPEIVAAVKEALVPETAQGVVIVSRLDDPAHPAPDPSTDVSIVLCGGSTYACHERGVAWLRAGVPTLMVGRSSVEVPGCTLGGAVASRLCSQDTQELVRNLGRWIVASTPKDVAFAANFPFCRRAVAANLIQAVAVSNAAVCTFNFIPGVVDFAMVTANEFKLALDIASVYDQKMGLERVPEIITVLAFGAMVRTVAGFLEKRLPKLAWLTRGAAGYLGAQATGNALVARFEGAGALAPVVDGVMDEAKKLGSLLQEKLGTLTGDVVKLGPDAAYFHPKGAGTSANAGEVVEAEPAPAPRWIELLAGGASAQEQPA